MPITYYTEKEHNDIVDGLIRKGLSLAQQICELKNFKCIIGELGSLRQCGDYCDFCPVRGDCPYPYKRYSK